MFLQWIITLHNTRELEKVVFKKRAMDVSILQDFAEDNHQSCTRPSKMIA